MGSITSLEGLRRRRKRFDGCELLYYCRIDLLEETLCLVVAAAIIIAIATAIAIAARVTVTAAVHGRAAVTVVAILGATIIFPAVLLPNSEKSRG